MTAPAETTSPPLPALRPARLEDFPHIQKLETTHDLLSLDEADWRAMWLDNPLRSRLGEDFPFGWVLEDAEQRIVGHLANIPTAYSFEGRELISVTGRAWVVAPEYRGVALWLMDEYFNQDGVDLFINTTVNGHAVDAFTSFGSQRVPIGNWDQACYWITGHRGFARTALRLKHVPMPSLFSAPTAAVLRMKDRFFARPPRRSQADSVEIIYEFDARFDEFWKHLVRQNPHLLLAKRDLATLNWHYAASLRARTLWILILTDATNHLRAYCVLKRHDHPQSGLRRMRLVDFQSLDEEDHLPALLHAALDRCVADDIHTLEHVGCDLWKMIAFDRYAPYRRQLPAWPYYFHAGDPALMERLKSPAVWDPSSYDGDASL